MTEEELSKQAALDRNKVGEGTIKFSGVQVLYYVIAGDMPMREHGIDLKDHLDYWGDGLLFVSESVPDIMRYRSSYTV